jgi:hypothetical protein
MDQPSTFARICVEPAAIVGHCAGRAGLLRMSSGAGDTIVPRDGAFSTATPSRLEHSAALISRNAPGEMGLKSAERSRFAEAGIGGTRSSTASDQHPTRQHRTFRV